MAKRWRYTGCAPLTWLVHGPSRGARGPVVLLQAQDGQNQNENQDRLHVSSFLTVCERRGWVWTKPPALYRLVLPVVPAPSLWG